MKTILDILDPLYFYKILGINLLIPINKKKPAGNFVQIVLKIGHPGENRYLKQYFLILEHGNLFIYFIITTKSFIWSLICLINALYFIVIYKSYTYFIKCILKYCIFLILLKRLLLYLNFSYLLLIYRNKIVSHDSAKPIS